MAKDGKSRAMPWLRFPEFREAWGTKRLDAIAKPTTERAGNRLITPFTVTTGVGLVSQQERFGRTIAGSAFKNYYVIRKDDFAYNKSATKAYPQGYITRFLGEEGAVPNSIFTCFRADPDSISPAYLDYLFAGNLHGKWLKRFIEVSARAHGSLSVDDADLMSLPVPVPEGPSSLAEQQKIADCLKSLDELIAAQGRKMEALKTHKRGLMQQLFPCEGETLPRLRFPEFRKAPEWKETAIGGMGEVITGNTPATSRKEYYGGKHLFVSPADISDLRFVEKTKTTLSEAGFAQSRPIKARSVLFVCIGSTIGKVAQNAGECATNQQINSVVASSSYSGDFIYYLLQMESKRIAKLAGIQAVPIINKTLFSSVEVVVPKLGEQQRIANCLSCLDAQIAAESEKLAALKTHKKGLMQQLFPSPEEGL